MKIRPNNYVGTKFNLGNRQKLFEDEIYTISSRHNNYYTIKWISHLLKEMSTKYPVNDVHEYFSNGTWVII